MAAVQLNNEQFAALMEQLIAGGNVAAGGGANATTSVKPDCPLIFD